jgi:hypothetical protein
MNRVAVRIRRRGKVWLVIGRQTTVECTSFDEAWETSVPFFAGRRR